MKDAPSSERVVPIASTHTKNVSKKPKFFDTFLILFAAEAKLDRTTQKPKIFSCTDIFLDLALGEPCSTAPWLVVQEVSRKLGRLFSQSLQIGGIVIEAMLPLLDLEEAIAVSVHWIETKRCCMIASRFKFPSASYGETTIGI